MRKYECFLIIDADLPDDAIAVVDDKLKGIVNGNGGMVLDYVPWGKKKLAYPVRKRTRGHYVLMEFAGESGLVAELERNMRLDERVLKFITVMLEDRFDPQAEQAKASKTPPPFGDDEESRRAQAAADGEVAEGTDEEDEALEDVEAGGEPDEDEQD
ncbi:MAG TPA: 30S ribosomal protein S6 [Syntrophobacteraceae bacterium]|jgi:small subunit ribosomal protein S6|nr:30S ribosomal protein S6 [Syntrophobacteraceae bacterium]HBD10017.1 30S ribosomal protein S6 [Syntrophobacteraceae bacterium]